MPFQTQLWKAYWSNGAPSDLVASILRYGVSRFIGTKKQTKVGSALWRWMVDCVASNLGEGDVDVLWGKSGDQYDFPMAVMRKLVKYRGEQLGSPTIADRELYMVSEDGTA